MKNFILLGMLLSLTGCLPLILADALIPDQKTRKKKKNTEESQVRRPLETTQEGSAHFYRRK